MPVRLSRFASVIDAGECYVVSNVAVPYRIVVDPSLGACAALLREPIEAAEFVAACPPAVDGQQLLSLLLRHGVVVEGHDDDEALRHRLVAASVETLEAADDVARRALEYRTPRVVRSNDLAASGGTLRPVRALLLGGCVLGFAEEALVRSGLRLGLDVSCRLQWPSLRAPISVEDRGWDPDFVVLQPSIETLLSGLWDEGALLSPARRRQRLATLNRTLARMIDGFARALEGRLGMVHNIAPPSISPFGRLDFRADPGFRTIVATLNATIDETAAGFPNVMVVDEERLAVRHGASRLFDDEVFPFGHHGGSVDPAITSTHQTAALSEALAEEYLSLFRIHGGAEAIRCVAVDLDGTLWPGNVAEDGFEWLDDQTTARWLHVGLHQALRLLKDRGILLITVSKGSRDVTLGRWDAVPSRSDLLAPEDFVLHMIGWGPKSEAIASACTRLGFRPRDVLFLDDNPVERAEVRARLPEVQAYDGDVASFRQMLLTDARCEVGLVTDEARRRTETTKGVLARAKPSGTDDRDEFLVSLGVVVTVGHAKASQLVRVVELLRRTTQFNTTGLDLGIPELEAVAADGGAVLVAHVRDRYADYGLCGVVVVRHGSVEIMALSCRVIGLEVDLAILGAALGLGEALTVGTRATVRPTARNLPAQQLFIRAGFAVRPGGRGFEILDEQLVIQRCAVPHVRLAVQERLESL